MPCHGGRAELPTCAGPHWNSNGPEEPYRGSPHASTAPAPIRAGSRMGRESSFPRKGLNLPLTSSGLSQLYSLRYQRLRRNKRDFFSCSPESPGSAQQFKTETQLAKIFLKTQNAAVGLSSPIRTVGCKHAALPLPRKAPARPSPNPLLALCSSRRGAPRARGDDWKSLLFNSTSGNGARGSAGRGRGAREPQGACGGRGAG